MIVNASIQLVVKTAAGGYDTKNNPVGPSKTPSPEIDCNLSKVSKRFEVYFEGQYVQAQYNVTIDVDDLPDGTDWTQTPEAVLKDSDGRDLGTWKVLDVKHMKLLQHYKIRIGWQLS